MIMQHRSVLWFQRSIHVWLILFLLSALPVAGPLWFQAVSPPLKGSFSLAPLLGDGPAWSLVVLVVIGLSIRNLVRPVQWWSAALIWCGYITLMDRAWMAGSGGQQLMANVLFWNIPLVLTKGPGGAVNIIRTAAFWIIRSQILLVYLVTGVYKVMGVHWLDGTALGIVASDPGYGPAWLAGMPVLSTLLNYAVLGLQFLLPVAVWFRSTRMPILIVGALFHLSTALWMGIPEMGLAFIACYPIWLGDLEAERSGRLFSAVRSWRK